MVDENLVFNAVKKKLDNDRTLSSLLNKQSGKSKVVIGAFMPRYILPMLQIVSTSNIINTVMTWSAITFNVNAYSRALTDNSVDTAELEKLLQRCNDLLHDQTLEILNHGFFSMYIEGRSGAIRDVDYGKAFLQGIMCRIFVIKIR